MEWIIPMTAGLLLDICGAFLIVRDFLYFVNRNSRIQRAQIELDERQKDRMKKGEAGVFVGDPFDTQTWNMLYDLDPRHDIRWGFIFLFSGFVLQIIANIINYYNL